MSRIGKKPIAIPEKTTVTVSGGEVKVSGPLGELSRSIHPFVTIDINEKQVLVKPAKKSVLSRALWGTYASHISNMISGVNAQFEKKLIIEGIGYRAELSGNSLKLLVGFSHPVVFDIPPSLTVSVEKNIISVKGSDKEEVGQFAAKIRAAKKPEPYKGKGIRYEDEVVRRKQGKKGI